MFKSQWLAVTSVALGAVLLLASQADAERFRLFLSEKQDQEETVRFTSLFGGPATQKFGSSLQKGDVVQKYGPIIQKSAPVIQKGEIVQKYGPTIQKYEPALQKYESAIQHAGPVQKGVYQKAVSYCPEDRCIRYHRHILGRKVRCCDPPIQAVLYATDPCGCPVEIPVCMPACCDGSPSISTRSGLLGCKYMTYDWCCGFRVKLQFHKHGDITVHYYGV